MWKFGMKGAFIEWNFLSASPSICMAGGLVLLLEELD
jgi:hypothetical protein